MRAGGLRREGRVSDEVLAGCGLGDAVVIRKVRFLSWADPEGARVLGARVVKRLEERLAGSFRESLFLTLTYAPVPGESSEALFERARREQHVALFVRALRERMGCGELEYFCKREFQANGTLHYHMIVVGLSYVPHDLVSEVWAGASGTGGFVWVERLTRARLKYVAKYVCKSGQVPPWVWELPSRGFKVTSCSRGFWGTKSSGPEFRQPTRVFGYVPLCVKASRAKSRMWVEVDGAVAAVRIGDVSALLCRLVECHGARAIQGTDDYGFTAYELPEGERGEVLAWAREFVLDVSARADADDRRGGGGVAAAVHLTEDQNNDEVLLGRFRDVHFAGLVWALDEGDGSWAAV